MARLSDFIDQDDIDDYLENAPEVVAAKLELGADVVDYAKSIAPVDSGEYKEGILVRRNGKGVGVYFTDPISNIIEYGTEDTPEFAVRARTEAHFRETGT